jgi:O-antigen/teichoic acid export membrane protein
LQLRVLHIARNVICNWLVTAAAMAVGFFLSPFIVHRLGNIAYGVWVLAVSAVNYLTLLDLGMRSSVLRFVSKGYTKGDHARASEIVSAAFWVRLRMSGVVLFLSAVLAAVFPVLFKIPAAMAGDARVAVLIIGAMAALTMSMGVLGGVLSALNRYDLLSYLALAQMTVRVIGVVTVLRVGKGIVAIALCELFAALLGNTLLMIAALKIYPELRISFSKPRRDILRQIWSYSVYAFLTTVALRVIYETDNLVVGAFVSASAVTFYSIGNLLCRYSDQFVGAMSLTFVPVASTYEASGDTGKLRSLYRNGTRAALALILPIVITLLIRGRSFIGLWMGTQYQQVSGTVLMILATGVLFSVANNTAGAIAYGIERHKTVARFAIGEGIANLALSVTLVHWMGIYGVALGTLIPSLFVQLLLWPRFITKLVGIRPRELVADLWGPVFLAAVPFALVSYAVESRWAARSISQFMLQVVLTLPVFLASLGILFRDSLGPRIRSWARAIGTWKVSTQNALR